MMMVLANVFLVLLPHAPSVLAQLSWTDHIPIYKNLQAIYTDFRKVTNNESVAVDVKVSVTSAERINLLEHYALLANGTTFITISNGSLILSNSTYYGLGIGHALCFTIEAKGASSIVIDDVVEVGVRVEFWSAEYVPDVAVTCLTLSRSVVGQGYLMSSNVTVENQGGSLETVNVTLWAGTTLIDFEDSVSLAGGNSTLLTFSWNTTGYEMGNYTISATVDSVPGEIDLADNTLVAQEEACVTIPGDVNADFDVDIFDIVKIASAYGSVKPDPNYNAISDIDGDGDIDIFDIVKAAGNYGAVYP
jgi:hypothetical protein